MEAGPSSMTTIIQPSKARKKTKLMSNSALVEEKTRTVRRKSGKLAEILNMPFDVLFEVRITVTRPRMTPLTGLLQIFAHLAPYDLLKLARTTKAFRHLLLNKTFISVWKAALEGVPGLPPCPADMTEPEWSNLVFSPHCHVCGI
jgi:hypothetical protein